MPRKCLSTARPAIKNVSGCKIIKAPLLDVARLLSDSATKTQWVSGLITEQEIERSDQMAFANFPVEFVIYQHYTLIPLLSDRDYVISAVWQATHNKDQTSVKSAILDLQSVSHDAFPVVNGRIRAALNFLVYTLDAMDDGSTRVHVECNVDPLGNMPQFMVNLYASTWSEKNLNALEKQLLKSNL